jgi:hypothetical protein
VTLQKVEINKFDPARRTSLFVEPTLPGYARVDLADLARRKEGEGTTAVRETIPVPEPRSAPEPRDHARLGPPVEIRDDSAAAKVSKRAGQPRPQAPMLLPVSALDDVVGAPSPVAPGTTANRAVDFASLPNSPGMSLER